MKKRWMAVALVFMLGVVSTACGLKLPGKEEKKEYVREVKTNDEQVEIGWIDMVVLAENKNHVYNGSFPEYYYVANPEMHRFKRVYIGDELEDVIPRENFEVIYDHCKNTDSQAGKGLPFLYSIYMTYYDKAGNFQKVRFTAYGDSFSDEAKEVIGKFNDLCGVEVFELPEKPVAIDADFIYNNLGITAEEYPAEDINAMIESRDSEEPSGWMASLASRDFHEIMDFYYAGLENETIQDLYATEILEYKDVTLDQRYEFAQRFAKKLGDQWAPDEYWKYMDVLVIKNQETGESFEILGGPYLKDNIVENGERPGVVIMTGPETMSYTADFIYNKTGEYIMVEFTDCTNFSEIARAFVEME